MNKEKISKIISTVSRVGTVLIGGVIALFYCIIVDLFNFELFESLVLSAFGFGILLLCIIVSQVMGINEN